MGVRDALLLNLTGSNFEALQSNDTARIKGDFSIKNTSDTEIFGVDVSTGVVNTTADITSSMDISSSLSSTGSFGRVVASTFLGDGVEIRDTLVRSPGLVTASAQLASYISGAFESGFFFGFQASSSISGGLGITGSFGRLQGIEFHGDGHNIKTTLPRSTGILSSSAQISADISGSFNKGFEFTGEISGSVTSTGSFGRVDATTFHGDGQNLQSTLPRSPGIVTSSAQLASDISGSFNKGFTFTTTSSLGSSSGSLISAAAAAWSTDANINQPRNSGRMADESANAALFFGGRLGTNPANICGQKITEEYNGVSWSEAGNMNTNRMSHYGFGSQNAAVATMGITSSLAPAPGSFNNSANTAGGRSAFSETEHYDGSTWSEVADIINNTRGANGFANGSQNAGIVSNGCISSPSGGPGYDECTFTYNGTNWTQVSCSPIRQYSGGSAGDASGMVMGGSALPHSTEGHSGWPSAYADNRAQRYNCAGDTWDTLPQLSTTHNYGFGFGTTNNTYIGGGQSQPTTAWNQGHHGNVFENFDGSSWSVCANLPTGTYNTEAAGGGPGIYAGGYQGPVYPGSAVATSATSYRWTESQANLTVDRMKANHITGDGSFIKGFFPNTVSGSAQLASNISGSFNKGFEFTGIISGSATSTGSFGQVYSNDFRGDGSELTNIPLNEGVVSSSAQLASNISASFQGGFEFGMTALEQLSGSYVGVSGSAFAYAGNATTMSISSICGSDFEFRIADTINQIKGTGFGTGVWSNGTARPTTAPTGAVIGVQKAFLSVGGYDAGNNCADTYKYDGDSWAASATMDNMRIGFGSAGTQNAALVFGGRTTNSHNPSQDSEAYSPTHRYRMFTEHYNGGAWSESERLPEGQIGWNQHGTGTQNAALQAFGFFQSPSPAAEVCHAKSNRYNGNTWSADANTVHFMRDGGFGGTQNAAIQAGGTTQDPAYGAMTCVQNYDGTSWSEGTVINTARLGASFAGVQNAGILFGNASPYSGITEEWNGSSWTERSDLNTTRAYMGCTGAGTSTAAAASTGYGGSAACANTEFWDATSTVTASFGLVENAVYHGDGSSIRDTLGRSVGILSGSAQIASAISGAILGGRGYHHIIDGTVSGSIFTTGSFADLRVKHLTGDGTSISASIVAGISHITASSEIAAGISASFTSGFELFSLRSGSGEDQIKSYYVGVSGSAFSHAGNATTMSINSICGSDFDYRLFDTVNQIKGSSYGTGVWSNATAMPVGVNGRGMAGTQNAFLSMGAYSDPNKTVTQKFNGNSWSQAAALNTGGRATAGVGTQNAAGLFGGYDHSYNGTEFYFGSTWSEGPNITAAAGWKGSAGTVNAALIYGGNGPSNNKLANTELYNGNVFTETADLNTARGLAAAGGTQNDAIYAGGIGGSGTTDTEIWNGTSWTEVSNLNTARWNSTGMGTANHHVVVTGHAGGAVCTNTEEWNGSSWSEVNDLTTERSYAGPAAGGLGSQGIYAGGDYSPVESPYTELWNATATTTGSFGLVKPRAGGINTKAFQVTSSLFKLPVFSDRELNYQAYEAEYSTGSLSGSVDRVADAVVGQNLGEMWFDSDKNAVGYTYSSSSLISQSFSFGTFANISASGNYVSCSQGFFTQSFYNYAVVTCYLTGSQI